MGIGRQTLTGLLGAAGIAFGVGSAQALPALQIFIEHVPGNGNTTQWDGKSASDPETWAEIGQNSFRLWIFGDVDKAGPMYDLRLVASYNSNLVLSVAPSGVLAFAPATTGGAGGYTDPSLSPAASYVPPVLSGKHPVLPPHGMFDNDADFLGAGDRSWFEWRLGDMTLMDSPLGNTQPSAPMVLGPSDAAWYPQISGGDMGQINVYNVTVSGLPVGAQVHFDVYAAQYGAYECDDKKATLNGTTCTLVVVEKSQGKKDEEYCLEGGQLSADKKDCTYTSTSQATRKVTYLDAPHSHDARWEQGAFRIETPEPLTLGVFGSGLIGFVMLRRRRHN